MLECIKEEKKGQNWKELCHCIHHWCICVPSSTLSQRLKKDGVVLEKGQGQGNVYDQKSGIRSMVDLFVYLKKKKKCEGKITRFGSGLERVNNSYSTGNKGRWTSIDGGKLNQQKIIHHHQMQQRLKLDVKPQKNLHKSIDEKTTQNTGIPYSPMGCLCCKSLEATRRYWGSIIMFPLFLVSSAPAAATTLNRTILWSCLVSRKASQT